MHPVGFLLCRYTTMHSLQNVKFVITVIVYNQCYMLMWVGNGELKIGTFFCVYFILIC